MQMNTPYEIDVWELMSRSQPVLPTDATTVWQPYLAGYMAHRKWHRYDMSTVNLFTGPRKFRWVVVNDCLLNLKWSTMGGLKIYLMGPPMSKHGDLKAEAEVLQWLVRSGLNARLSAEDIALYGLTDCEVDYLGPEFLYRVGDYKPEAMVGQSWRAWRNVQNAATRGKWVTRVWRRPELTPEMLETCESISGRWSKERDKSPKHALNTLHALETTGGLGYVTMNQDPEGLPLGWSIYPQVMPSALVCHGRHWVEGRYPSNDASRYVHMADSQVLADLLGPDVFINIGSPTGDKGLLETKRHRRCTELVIYRAPTHRKLTKEDWVASRKFRA